MNKANIFYNSESLLIRLLKSGDIKAIVEGEIKQGWVNQDDKKYLLRLSDMAEGKCLSFVALYEDEPCGYINVYHNYLGTDGAFYPGIVDFGVLETYRNKGIGSRLMDIAESYAFTLSNKIYLDVGLHSGYGSAQRLYIKRGYLPDGKGLYYNGKQAQPYETYSNDDELTIKLYKDKPNDTKPI